MNMAAKVLLNRCAAALWHKRKKKRWRTQKKFTFVKGFAWTCGNPLMSCLLSSSSCQQCTHRSHTSRPFALRCIRAKRKGIFPLRKLFRLVKIIIVSPGQKRIRTKSALTAAASANPLRQLHVGLTSTAAFASTMKCTRKCKKAPSKLSGDCIAVQRRSRASTSQRLKMDEKQRTKN